MAIRAPDGANNFNTNCNEGCPSLISRIGTRQLNNWRLTGYLKQTTRSTRLGTCSVLRSARKVQI